MKNFSVHVPITEDMRVRMKLRAKPTGFKTSRPTSTEGKGRIWGFLGEEVVLDYLEGSQLDSTKDHDLIYKGFTFDIKTKTRASIPKPWYDASVDACMSGQKPDFYIFVSIVAPRNLVREPEKKIINHPYSDAYIMGVVERNRFYDLAKYYEKGDKDPDNGIIYRESIYTVPYHMLRDVRLMKG